VNATKYEETPTQVKHREMRNRARYDAEKKGLVKKGDGKDVDHKTPLARGGTNAPSNRRVITEAENRSWRKGKSGYKP
jgi:hypothetical protein